MGHRSPPLCMPANKKTPAQGTARCPTLASRLGMSSIVHPHPAEGMPTSLWVHSGDHTGLLLSRRWAGLWSASIIARWTEKAKWRESDSRAVLWSGSRWSSGRVVGWSAGQPVVGSAPCRVRHWVGHLPTRPGRLGKTCQVLRSAMGSCFGARVHARFGNLWTFRYHGKQTFWPHFLGTHRCLAADAPRRARVLASAAVIPLRRCLWSESFVIQRIVPHPHGLHLTFLAQEVWHEIQTS
jgi:hypothetical protein